MSGYTTIYDVRCEHCLVIIRLGVVSSNPDREHDDARLIEALNELLVDYGWLPTRSGTYCRNHATGVRGAVVARSVEGVIGRLRRAAGDATTSGCPTGAP